MCLSSCVYAIRSLVLQELIVTVTLTDYVQHPLPSLQECGHHVCHKQVDHHQRSFIFIIACVIIIVTARWLEYLLFFSSSCSSSLCVQGFKHTFTIDGHFFGVYVIIGWHVSFLRRLIGILRYYVSRGS